MIIRQAIAFVLVGVVNTCFGYTLYAFFLFCGMAYWVALLIATCFGILFNFYTNGKFVFNNPNRKLLLKFIAVYAFLYVCNAVLIRFIYLFESDYYWAGLIAVIPVSGAAFILNRYIVFNKNKSHREMEFNNGGLGSLE